jgi:hypothetical protein
VTDAPLVLGIETYGTTPPNRAGASTLVAIA